MARAASVSRWSAPQQPLPVGHHPLVLRYRVLQPPRGAVGVAEAAARGDRVGMVGPEQPLPVGEHALVGGDRLLGLPRGPVGGGQAGPRGQRGRVVRARPSAPGRRAPAGRRRSPRASWPAARYAPARLTRADSVSAVRRAELPLGVGERPLVQPDAVAAPARRLVGGGELRPHRERLPVPGRRTSAPAPRAPARTARSPRAPARPRSATWPRSAARSPSPGAAGRGSPRGRRASPRRRAAPRRPRPLLA